MDPVGLSLPRLLRPFANACLCYTEVLLGVCLLEIGTWILILGGGWLLSHVMMPIFFGLKFIYIYNTVCGSGRKNANVSSSWCFFNICLCPWHHKHKVGYLLDLGREKQVNIDGLPGFNHVLLSKYFPAGACIANMFGNPTITYTNNQRLFQHTPRAHPRQSPKPIVKEIPL